MVQADGKKFDFLDESHIDSSVLETFEFDSHQQLITTITKEFSAVCPFSGLPDVARVEIYYKPIAGKCIELKSLKYYLTSFRNVGIYQEGVTKRIYEDLVDRLLCDVFIITRYMTSGGFDTVCQEGCREYYDEACLMALGE